LERRGARKTGNLYSLKKGQNKKPFKESQQQLGKNREEMLHYHWGGGKKGA